MLLRADRHPRRSRTSLRGRRTPRRPRCRRSAGRLRRAPARREGARAAVRRRSCGRGPVRSRRPACPALRSTSAAGSGPAGTRGASRGWRGRLRRRGPRWARASRRCGQADTGGRSRASCFEATRGTTACAALRRPGCRTPSALGQSPSQGRSRGSSDRDPDRAARGERTPARGVRRQRGGAATRARGSDAQAEPGSITGIDARRRRV